MLKQLLFATRNIQRDTGTPAATRTAELHPELPRTAHPQRQATQWVGVGVPRSLHLELWLAAIVSEP